MIRYFIHHRLAPHLLFIIIIIGGLLAASQINIQLLPDRNIPYINIFTQWLGHPANEVDEAATKPMVDRLTNLYFVNQVSSLSMSNSSTISLKIPEEDSNLDRLIEVQETLNQTNTPQDIRLFVQAPQPSETIAKLLISHPDRAFVNNMNDLIKYELNQRGIREIKIDYWRQPNIDVNLSQQNLIDLQLPMQQLGQQLQAQLSNASFGQQSNLFTTVDVLGEQPPLSIDGLSTLSFQQANTQIPINAIASLSTSSVSDGNYIMQDGAPATQLTLKRANDQGTLEVSRIFHDWLKTFREKHPDLAITIMDEQWVYVAERLGLLLKNAFSGFLVVSAVLILFFGIRRSFWVIVCIPTCILGALAALLLIGGTLNMISMFAFILSIGLIVDDSIVVAERIIERREQLPPKEASERGAKRMFKPVMASSLTTIAAFMPLLLVTGVIGTFLKEIPIVVICIIAISIVECFLVMPGHLSHVKQQYAPPHPWRARFLSAFSTFKDETFIPFCRQCCDAKGTTLTLCLCFFVFSCVFMASGHLGFNFFPNLSGQTIFANIEFTPNTTLKEAEAISAQVEQALYRIPDSQKLIQASAVYMRKQGFNQPGTTPKPNSDQYSMVKANLVPIDQRQVDNFDIVSLWRSQLPNNAHIKSIMIGEPDQGPTTDVITIRIFQDELDRLSQASDFAIDWFESKGISEVTSSQGKMIDRYELEPTPAALAMNLDKNAIQAQLSPAIRSMPLFQKESNSGFYQARLKVDQHTEQQPFFIEHYPIIAQGKTLPLEQVATIKKQKTPEIITTNQGRRSIEIVAKLNSEKVNPQRIFNAFETELKPQLNTEFQAQSELAGSFETQSKTLSQMKTGAIIGLSLIYIILAWTFSSWMMPLVIITIIPFAVIGALWGHWLLGYEASLLTIFGLFALSGIVINDSIILITGFKEQYQTQDALSAMMAAIRDRFRPVIITSLTTIGGLTPLLFETSLQAQILIPPTITIVFGLLFSLFWILVLVPVITLYASKWLKSDDGTDCVTS